MTDKELERAAEAAAIQYGSEPENDQTDLAARLDECELDFYHGYIGGYRARDGEAKQWESHYAECNELLDQYSRKYQKLETQVAELVEVLDALIKKWNAERSEYRKDDKIYDEDYLNYCGGMVDGLKLARTVLSKLKGGGDE